MGIQATTSLKAALLVSVSLTVAGCQNGIDFDLRGLADGFSTSAAAKEARTAPRPTPDANGVISYPNYQVVIARGGETVSSIANRLGLAPAELGRYNGIPDSVTLRDGEIVALPRRVGSNQITRAGTIATGAPLDVAGIATSALDDAESTPAPSTVTTAPAATPSATPAAAPTQVEQTTSSDTLNGREPVRHQVQRGETAYTISRKYGISVRALAEWNGLGADLSVQEGRYLLVPVPAEDQPAASTAATPGTGSTAPTPPSSSTPLPKEEAATTPAPAAPDLGATQTSSAEMQAPVSGSIIRAYDKNSSKFVLFAASAGSTVKAAKDGTVKLISTNADGVKIMVIDHGDGLQTGYSFIDGISVKKGERVSRGQSVATVTNNEFGALQFMVFKGTQTVDPAPYLN